MLNPSSSRGREGVTEDRFPLAHSLRTLSNKSSFSSGAFLDSFPHFITRCSVHRRLSWTLIPATKTLLNPLPRFLYALVLLMLFCSKPPFSPLLSSRPRYEHIGQCMILLSVLLHYIYTSPKMPKNACTTHPIPSLKPVVVLLQHYRLYLQSIDVSSGV